MRLKKIFNIYIDTETGGLSHHQQDVLTLAAIIEKDKEIVHEQEWKIKGYRVTEEAMKVNGINLEEHNKTAQSREKVAQEFLELFKKNTIETYCIIGQYVQFDIGFLNEQLFTEENTPFKNCFIKDTKTMGALYKKNHNAPLINTKLQTLSEHFGLTVDFHNALEDVKATRHVYHNLNRILYGG